MKSTNNVLIDLYRNTGVRTKVDNALDTGSMTYDEIVEFCAENGIEISKASITRYKQKREEAANTGTPLIELLDQRRKTGSVIDLKNKREMYEEEGKYAASPDTFDQTFETVDKVYNDIQVLDTIIQKGMTGLNYTETVELKDAMRAIEIKARITDNSLNGLSLVGLRELRLRAQARESAIAQAVLKYIPEDKHEEVEEYIANAEDEFYKNLDLTEEDRKITESLKTAGIDF